MTCWSNVGPSCRALHVCVCPDILNILTSILFSQDIRNQHRYRQQRKQQLLRLQETVVNLRRKASYLEEKLNYYQRYVKACLDNLAKSGVR